MTAAEIVKRLEPWAARHKAMMWQYKLFRETTGAMPDCNLWRPIFDLWTAYTVAVSEIVGDKDEWLQWYELECDMGARPKEVESLSGIKIRVRTLHQLARVIMWGQP